MDNNLGLNTAAQMQGYDPFKVQVGGNHYAKYPIQPMEYIEKNKLPFADGCVVKYITRWRDKGGIEDLRKAKHFIEMLISLEEQKKQDEFTNQQKVMTQCSGAMSGFTMPTYGTTLGIQNQRNTPLGTFPYYADDGLPASGF